MLNAQHKEIKFLAKIILYNKRSNLNIYYTNTRNVHVSNKMNVDFVLNLNAPLLSRTGGRISCPRRTE